MHLFAWCTHIADVAERTKTACGPALMMHAAAMKQILGSHRMVQTKRNKTGEIAGR